MRARNKIEIITDVVSDYFKVTKDDVRSHRRYGDIILARQLIHYFSRIYTRSQVSYRKIGIWTGNGKPFNHATVMFSIRSVERTISARTFRGDPVYGDYLEDFNIIKDKLDKLLI